MISLPIFLLFLLPLSTTSQTNPAPSPVAPAPAATKPYVSVYSSNNLDNKHIVDAPTIHHMFEKENGEYLYGEYKRSHLHEPGTYQNPGATNWKLLKEMEGKPKFSSRNGHAVTTYPCPSNLWDEVGKSIDCLWLAGGRSEEYQMYNLDFSERNADVWYSKYGTEWFQVSSMSGDFINGIGNFDALHNDKTAPWYGRYGHSLDGMDGDGDGNLDAMVLLGGFSPNPSNDVWISKDGFDWRFVHYAPWAKRAWHATSVYKGKLYIIGGSPLTNDVWTGELTTKVVPGGVGQRYPFNANVTASNLTITWKQVSSYMSASSAWSPRAGHCVVNQLRRNSWNESNSDTSMTERMFLIGGFGGWPQDDDRYDGERSRNDIFITDNGINWTKIEPPVDPDTGVPMLSMPWGARAWHGCATWHSPNDRHIGVNKASWEAYYVDEGDGDALMHPKIYMGGGGYIGTKLNNVVRIMEGYSDMWYSRDGQNWVQVSFTDGAGSSAYTTQEWAKTTVEDEEVFLGKWGHTMTVFRKQEDLDVSGTIEEGEVGPFFFSGSVPDEVQLDPTQVDETEADLTRASIFDVTSWREIKENETDISTLMIIGGDTVDNGALVRDIFVAMPGLHCEIEGVKCSGRGSCAPGNYGCICFTKQFVGEYCELENKNYKAAGVMIKVGATSVISVIICSLWLV